MTVSRSGSSIFLGLAMGILALPCWARAGETGNRLSFVFFLADDMGWRDAGCYGSTFYETPNIDRLAKQGMRFTAAYAASPVCSPTRASILTGKYPARLGTTDWFGAPQPNSVDRHWTRNKPLLPARYVDHLPPKPDQHVDGASLVPLLRQTGTISRPALYWHYPHYSNQGGRPGSAVRCGDWKLIEFFEDGRLELYDMQTDLGETRNLAGQYGAKTAELHLMLQDWRKSVGARLPTPNPNRDAGQASLEKTDALAADD
jgi:arylsulfatase A-like enzyme